MTKREEGCGHGREDLNLKYDNFVKLVTIYEYSNFFFFFIHGLAYKSE